MPLIYKCELCGTEQDMTTSEGIPHCPVCNQPMQRRRIPVGGVSSEPEEVDNVDAAETVPLDRSKILKIAKGGAGSGDEGKRKVLEIRPRKSEQAPAEAVEEVPSEPSSEVVQERTSSSDPLVAAIRQEGEKTRRQLSEQLALLGSGDRSTLAPTSLRFKRLVRIVGSFLIALYLVMVLWETHPAPPLITVPTWVFLVVALTALLWNVYQLLRKPNSIKL